MTWLRRTESPANVRGTSGSIPAAEIDVLGRRTLGEQARNVFHDFVEANLPSLNSSSPASIFENREYWLLMIDSRLQPANPQWLDAQLTMPAQGVSTITKQIRHEHDTVHRQMRIS